MQEGNSCQRLIIQMIDPYIFQIQFINSMGNVQVFVVVDNVYQYLLSLYIYIYIYIYVVYYYFYYFFIFLTFLNVRFNSIQFNLIRLFNLIELQEVISFIPTFGTIFGSFTLTLRNFLYFLLMNLVFVLKFLCLFIYFIYFYYYCF